MMARFLLLKTKGERRGSFLTWPCKLNAEASQRPGEPARFTHSRAKEKPRRCIKRGLFWRHIQTYVVAAPARTILSGPKKAGHWRPTRLRERKGSHRTRHPAN